MSGLLEGARQDWRQRTWYGRLCYPWEALELLCFAAFWGFILLAASYVKALRGEPPFDSDNPAKYKESDDA